MGRSNAYKRKTFYHHAHRLMKVSSWMFSILLFLPPHADCFSLQGSSQVSFTQRQHARLCSLNSGESENPIVNGHGNALKEQFEALRKQKPFKSLPDDCCQLIARGSFTAVPTSNQDDIVPINSMVLQIQQQDDNSLETIILVILAEDDKIDLQKVTDFWNQKQATTVTTVKFSPTDQLEFLVGYASGSVPPIGHMSSSSNPIVLPTILDASLIQNTARRKLLGGGGHPDFQSLIRLSAMVGMDHVEVGNIITSSTEKTQQQDDNNIIAASLPAPRMISLPEWGSSKRPKPLFPVETPAMDIAQELLKECKDKDLPPSDTTWVTLVAQIGGVRQISKRLVFCDLEPPGFDETTTEENGNTARKAWKSATDGQDLSVQLIGGATLCQAIGEVQGQAALKRLQQGQLLLIQAKLNVYRSRDSLQSWIANRKLDLVLVSYQVLYQFPGALPPQLAASDTAPPTSAAKPKKPYLQWQDVFPADVVERGPQVFIELVDDVESLGAFSRNVSKLLHALETSDHYSSGIPSPTDGHSPTNGTTSNYAFAGIDCEWKPGFYMDNPREPQPVLLMQISIEEKVYILDFQSLARPLLDMHEATTETETALNDALQKLFQSKLLFKVGFQLVQDLQRLSISYPNLPALQEVCSVLEASALAIKVMRSRRQKNALHITSSLSRLTEHFLEKSVNKAQQVSDWSQRPLTAQQLEYAALDAAVTQALLKQFFQEMEVSVFLPGPEVGRWKGDATYSKLLTSWRFLFLQPDTDDTVMKKLKAKSVLSNQPLLIVSQTWSTADDPPKLPSVPEEDAEGPYTDVFGIVRVPSASLRIRPNSTLELQQSFLSSLVGKRTGRSKEKCLTSLLEAAIAEDSEILPEGSRLQYPPRSGFVEFKDGLALFVNMPASASRDSAYQPRSYPNEFLEEGRVLTWYLHDHEWVGGKSPLALKILDPNSVIVVFVRVSNKHFLCCGPCRVKVPETRTSIVSKEKQESWYLVQLNLHLLEWGSLTKSSDFVSLIS
ncbi:Pfam:3_5_exonuc [Seminavis robusta]|uniref:Pfam:3_5_exonuc n=1 Tax=Seminavis robusta TaxID=568900 RepID=A0A9N8H959_9STRA|nr:Pfam:3_5_exonuc [Seminavis robusta]|eukprot:Sro180_g078720.1 Pfam:3_5_exonuc (1007) ;mRNA; f:44203-47223